MTLHKIMDSTRKISCRNQARNSTNDDGSNNTIAISNSMLDVNLKYISHRSEYRTSIFSVPMTKEDFFVYTPSSSCENNLKRKKRLIAEKNDNEKMLAKFEVSFMTCLKHTRDFLKRMEKYFVPINDGIVVFSLVIWDTMNYKECALNTTTDESNSEDHNLLISTLEALSVFAKKNSHLDVYWRTPLYRADAAEHNINQGLTKMRMSALNWFATRERENYHLPNFDVIDAGGAVYSRSFDEERIHGNSKEHYGPEARVVMVQMLANKINDKQIRRL